DARRGGVEPEPVARLLWTAQTDLEAAVAIDVEARIVDHTGSPARHAAVLGVALDGDRDVDRAVHAPAHDVGVLRAHRGIEVDCVGVVTGELPGRRDDALEARTRRVGLEEGRDPALDQVHQGAGRARDGGLAHAVPRIARPAAVA